MRKQESHELKLLDRQKSETGLKTFWLEYLKNKIFKSPKL